MKKICILVLENIRSVENTASIFRTSECLGVEKIILVGTTPAPIDRFGRKRRDFAKVSLGSEDLMDWDYANDIDPVISGLKDDGFQIIALEQTNEAVKDIRNFKTSSKFAMIVGNEVDGVSRRALKSSERALEIPMRGKKESLNVAVATGIALFMLI